MLSDQNRRGAEAEKDVTINITSFIQDNELSLPFFMRVAVLSNECCCINGSCSRRTSTERTEVVLFDGTDRELDRDTSVSGVDRVERAE